MPDERWAEIYANLPVFSPPQAPQLVRMIPPGRATCAEHCRGKHEIEAVFTCRRCGGRKYALIAHEYAHREGHYFYTFEPMNGAPPHTGGTPECCRAPMVRE